MSNMCPQRWLMIPLPLADLLVLATWQLYDRAVEFQFQQHRRSLLGSQATARAQRIEVDGVEPDGCQ